MIKVLWEKISKSLDIGTYEGWMKNGLPFIVSIVILLYDVIIGIVLLILKLTENL